MESLKEINVTSPVELESSIRHIQRTNGREKQELTFSGSGGTKEAEIYHTSLVERNID